MTMMGPVTTALRDAFEPLFVQYKVDVAFWGHIHVSASSSLVWLCGGETLSDVSVSDLVGATDLMLCVFFSFALYFVTGLSTYLSIGSCYFHAAVHAHVHC